jgi:hypothetical protein
MIILILTMSEGSELAYSVRQTQSDKMEEFHFVLFFRLQEVCTGS